jgi:cyanophycin synthetase
LSGKKGLHASLAWVDNKPVLKKKCMAAGIPIARGGTAFGWKKTKKIFNQLKKCGYSVIIKPSIGSRSRHTTTHIKDETELHQAFIKAKRLSPWVIVEEELVGMVYRGTVVGGRVVGIRRKDPPQVTGDGAHSMRELIEIENSRPERQGPVYRKIKIEDKNFKLAKGVDLDAVPKKSETVTVSEKTSISSGGGSTDVTDIAHPDIIVLLKKIAVTLDDQLVGADFIVFDITRPLSDQPHSGVIECNSLPFIDVHLFPLTGKPRDTAKALWDAIEHSQKNGSRTLVHKSRK